MSRPPLQAHAGAQATPDAGDWARTPERSNMLVLRFFCWLALTCGRRVVRLILPAVSFYFLLFSPSQRRHIKRYLRRTVGE